MGKSFAGLLFKNFSYISNAKNLTVKCGDGDKRGGRGEGRKKEKNKVLIVGHLVVSKRLVGGD